MQTGPSLSEVDPAAVPKTQIISSGAAWAGALNAWIAQGRTGPVARWLARELDPDGVPRTLPVVEWLDAFRRLDEATRIRPAGWPEAFDARAEGWFRALLRFSRPDGTPAFGPVGLPRPSGKLFHSWAERLADPGFNTVADWWFPPKTPSPHAPPPLPADSRPDRPLAVLRANWMRDGDFLTVDHRAAGPVSRVELFGRGRPWLGPDWDSAGDLAVGRARPTLWISHSTADLAEWSFSVGKARVTRTALLLRGRQLALLAELWDGPGDPGSWRVGLTEGVDAGPMPDCRGLALKAPRARVSPRALPIGLPRLPYTTDRGSFKAEGRSLRLAGPSSGRRAWRPLLLSWDPQRDRRPVHWRTLTVTEDRKVCGPDVAFAARVSWGRDEGLVVYKSLAPPAIRAFLGFQTKVKFLVGLFTCEGDVEPLVQVNE